MFICRLFYRDQPFEQVEARLLADGQITLGRDPSADWPMPDADQAVSRIHCTLSVQGGRLMLCDKSTNGTFLQDDVRAPRDVAVEIAPQQSIYLGPFAVLIDQANEALDGAGAATTLHVSLTAPHAAVPADWSDGVPPPPAHRDASLLEAFCEGAQLDASVLSSQDPVELMRKIGAIYQQTVLGVGALMADRTRLKGELNLQHTTIRAWENNPFKWAPTRKLAQDLLCGEDPNFLSGADAVRASFVDLGRHLNASAAGAKAAAELALTTLAPNAIEAEAKAERSLLRGRHVLCWQIHNRRYQGLLATSGANDSAVGAAFSQAYAQASDQEPQ
jgi:predicted component of type VI protein secretion system